MHISFFNKPKLPVVLQDQISECQLACLSMVFQYHGLDVDLASIRSKYPAANTGSTFYQAIEICENEGFLADVYEMEIEHFPELALPAILHWDLNHFVVLKSIKNKKYTIHDPAVGEIEYSEADFSKHFTGFALQIEGIQQEQFDIAKSAWESHGTQKLSLTYFIKRTSGLSKTIGFVMFMTFVVQILSMVIPAITQVLIDDFIVSNTTEYIWFIVAGGLSIIGFRFFAEIIKSWSVIYIGYRWHANFSSYFFTKMLRLPADYFETRSVADIFSRFNALEELKSALTDRIVQGVIDGLMSIITLTAMFLYDPMLAGISFIFAIVYAAFRQFIVSKEIKANKKLILQKVKETSSFYESVMNIHSVKTFGKEAQRYQDWKKHYLGGANESISLAKSKMWYSSTENLLTGLEKILLLALCSFVVIEGSLTLGMMFAFFAYQVIFAEQSKSMVNNFLQLKLLGVYLDRLNDIEACSTEEFIDGAPGIHPQIKGRIELKNISYKYPGTEKNVLENINLVIEAGENIVITGPSGCGKSTLLRIIMGLAQPDSGDVLIDGVNLKTMGLRHYRKHIASVSQKESLISASILDNVTFFSKPVDMEKVIDSCHKARIHNDICSFPMQYQTLSGDIGNTLSGGQAQRVLLARALYHEPSILFMDEATSSLDQETEKHIAATLMDLPMTRVSVAHRKETIAMASRTIALNKV